MSKTQNTIINHLNNQDMTYYFIVQQTINGQFRFFGTKDGMQYVEQESLAYRYKYIEDARKAVRETTHCNLDDERTAEKQGIEIIPICPLSLKEKYGVLYNDPKEVYWEEGVRFISLKELINGPGEPPSFVVKEISISNGLLRIRNEQTGRETWIQKEDLKEIELLPFLKYNSSLEHCCKA